jgi:hypothetical protein
MIPRFEGAPSTCRRSTDSRSAQAVDYGVISLRLTRDFHGMAQLAEIRGSHRAWLNAMPNRMPVIADRLSGAMMKPPADVSRTTWCSP